MQDLTDQKKLFYTLVAPSRPNPWEIDEIFDGLVGYSPEVLSTLLAQVPAIWPVSHSLCFIFLAEGVGVVGGLPVASVADWVRQFLSVYETAGLYGARRFIAETEGGLGHSDNGGNGATFDEVCGLLGPYLTGISGRALQLQSDTLPWTDTETV